MTITKSVLQMLVMKNEKSSTITKNDKMLKHEK